MKKLLLCIVLLLLTSFSQARIQSMWSQIVLHVRFEDPTVQVPIRRSPVSIPLLYIDGYNLQFETPCDNSILRLVNEEGEVQYSTSIPANTTTLTLPSYLSGVYELQIIQGLYCLYGDVKLQYVEEGIKLSIGWCRAVQRSVCAVGLDAWDTLSRYRQMLPRKWETLVY